MKAWSCPVGVLVGVIVAGVVGCDSPPKDREGSEGNGPPRPAEWRVGDAYFGSPKMQIATLTATTGELMLGVWCTDDVVDRVVIGFANDPPSIWVHGTLYMRMNGGPVRSNWSGARTWDIGPWRGSDDELELLDAPQVLRRLGMSGRLDVEAVWHPDDFSIWATFDGSEPPTPLQQSHPLHVATFDGSGLATTLQRMSCRIP